MKPEQPCDEQVERKIVDALRDGNRRDAAANVAGIDGRTLRGWCSRGRRGEEPFAAFLSRVLEAEADAEKKAVAIIRDAALVTKNWQAAAFWLERRKPKQWGRRDAGKAGTSALPDPEKMTAVQIDAAIRSAMGMKDHSNNVTSIETKRRK